MSKQQGEGNNEESQEDMDQNDSTWSEYIIIESLTKKDQEKLKRFVRRIRLRE